MKLFSQTTSDTRRDVQQILSHYCQAVRLPLCLFHGNELISRLPKSQDFNLPLLLMSCLENTLPPIWYADTPEHLFFGGLRMEATGDILFLGPVLPFSCSRQQADVILARIGRTGKDRQTLVRHFSTLPLCDLPTLQANLTFLDFLLNGLERPLHHVPFQWKKLLPTSDISPFYPTEPDSDWLERNILSLVKYGQLNELNQFLNQHVLRTDFKLNITDDATRLRMQRNYMLGANMLISHAAIDGGLDYGFGTQISSEYIDKIQNAPTEADLTNLFVQLTRDYTRQVARLKQLTFVSPLTKQINQYVLSHLYEKITPSSIADELGRNCTYLCSCFKRETGKTIANHIQECKIDEAKRLLEFSSLSIIEISELLCFTNASYFCKIFRKWQGTSPTQFRGKKEA